MDIKKTNRFTFSETINGNEYVFHVLAESEEKARETL